jgi:hypothetical protein
MNTDVSGARSVNAASHSSLSRAPYSNAPAHMAQAARHLDTHSPEMAKNMLSLDPDIRAMKMGEFSPVEQGQMLRAMDGLKNPRPADRDCVGHKNLNKSISLDIARLTRSGADKAAKAPVDPLGVSATFGADVGALVARSPSLTRDLQALQNDGWTIVAASGGGSYCDKSTKTITIDTASRNTAELATRSISHEVGHARYTANVDTSSRAAYVRTQLADEGAATLANIRVQREIIANGGPDIGISGNPSNHAAYNAAYDAFVAGGSESVARDTIGTIFGNGERTSTTNQTYTDYYGGSYDRVYGTPTTP